MIIFDDMYKRYLKEIKIHAFRLIEKYKLIIDNPSLTKSIYLISFSYLLHL